MNMPSTNMPADTLVSRDLTDNQTHDFFVTEKAHYTLMRDPRNGMWVAWVTDAQDIHEIEYFEHPCKGAAKARLRQIYSQLEEGLLQ
ncbi:MAG: hypothetical protein IMF06_05400 [Proteobacteria bacterium]|nr:hypothetical protein [Pseudomonadota bacterium]